MFLSHEPSCVGIPPEIKVLSLGVGTGLTEGKRISALCDAYNLPIAPHVGGGGILSIAASVQYSAAIPNFQILEHSHRGHANKGRIARSYPVPKDGRFVLDETPGLGVEIDEDRVF